MGQTQEWGALDLEAIEQAGTWLYWQCTDFVIHLASIFDVTYRDSNSFLFFIAFPLVTAVLVLLVAAQFPSMVYWFWRARKIRP